MTSRSLSPIRATLLAFVAGLSLLFGAPSEARAEDKDQDPEAASLRAANEAVRYRLKTEEPTPSKIETGGAAILVKAPISVARSVVTDFRHYAKFIQPFEQSKILSRKDGTSEVYLEVPVAHGAVLIWAVAKIGPPVKDGAGEKIVAEFVKGNVDGFRAVWRLRAVDAQTTIVKLEIFVDPHLPLPASMVTPELEYGADKGVSGVRARAESLAAEQVAKN